jgi:DNA-binding transcriptional regulator YhcF (GntR family)
MNPKREQTAIDMTVVESVMISLKLRFSTDTAVLSGSRSATSVSHTGQVSELAGWLGVDGRSSTPIFEQLRVGVIAAVGDGRLAPGARLPTVRELAADLGLAVNTVARTYRELETAGIVETRGRNGTFVARRDPTDAAMAEAARIYAEKALALGVELARARRYLDAAFGSAELE